MTKDVKYWQDLSKTVDIPCHAYIAGEFVQSSDGATIANISPIDGQTLGEFPLCTADDVNRAVAHARDTFESGVWSRLSATERKNAIIKFTHILEQHTEQLAVLETMDMGKTITNALGDITGAINHFRWMAESAEKKTGDVIESNAGVHTTCAYEPIGVVAAIVPWNYPFMMAMWKMAPAIATGNSFVIKPAERSSLTMMYMAKLWHESDLPNGVFQVVTGKGSVVGETLARHMDVDVISFTGSSTTARHLLVCAGQSNMKRVYVEAGGKSPAVILKDADLDIVTSTMGVGIFYNQGEVCCATSRAIVHADLHDDFIAKMKDVAKQWMPGNPFCPNSKNGAVVDSAHQQSVQKYIDTAKQQNTMVDTGLNMESAKPFAGGSYVAPTIFADVKPGDSIFDNEIFGPVLAVTKFNTEDEALALANNTIYGLGASVYTQSIKSAHTFSRAIKSGAVWINTYGTGNDATPFGGYKQSGNGRDRSLHALDKYQEIKTTVWKYEHD